MDRRSELRPRQLSKLVLFFCINNGQSVGHHLFITRNFNPTFYICAKNLSHFSLAQNGPLVSGPGLVVITAVLVRDTGASLAPDTKVELERC